MTNKGFFKIGENSIIEDGKIILNDIPSLNRYIGEHKYKYFTNNGRRFKVIFAHAGYPLLWREEGF